LLRSDEIRKRLFGAAPEAKLLQAAYTPDASEEVFSTMLRGVAAASAAGHAVIADATFMDKRLRAKVQRAAGGTRFLGVWLQAPLAELEARVAARRGDASDADVDVLRRAAGHDPRPGSWLAVDATDAAAALAAVMFHLKLTT
jgi:predicted kinase